MNIVFFGSSNFASLSLKSLIASRHKVCCVVTQPDRQKGRGLLLQGTVMKKIALESGIKVYQPENVNGRGSLDFLKGLNADLFVVSAYGQILSQEVLDIPRIFSVNAHASLLPKYRGASPINWAIINGETATGVTIIKMTKGLDSGPIITSKAVDISDADTCVTLEEKLSQDAASLLADTLLCVENNNCRLIEQDEKKASFAPKLYKKDAVIDWGKPAKDVSNLIRGCLGWPGAHTYYNGKLLKIFQAKTCLSAHSDSLSCGKVIKISKEGIIVACGSDNLIIEELQLEGKRKMNPAEFIAGHKICIGETLGKK